MTTLYLAGGQPTWEEVLTGHRLLVSYAEARQLRIIGQPWAGQVLLDSGAFSVWSKPDKYKPIVLGEYIDFIKRHEPSLDGYITLDEIPSDRRPETVKRAVDQTIRNTERVVLSGLMPIPVYHEGDEPEPGELLDYYVSTYPRVALAATTSRGKARVVDWLRPIVERHPTARFHGLALTQPRILSGEAGVQLDTADSSTWINFVRFGIDANAYLLKGRSPAFCQEFGITEGQFDWLKDTSPAFRRRVAIAALEDICNGGP